MNSIPNICRQLGISHQQLSQLIGCDRSVVSRAAKGQRSLPLHAHLQLAELVISVTNHPAPTPVNSPTVFTEKEIKEVEDRLEELVYQQTMLRRRMRHYRQKTTAAYLLQQLLATTPTPLTTRQAKQQQLLAEHASRRARQCSPGQLALLEIKLQLLEQETALLQAILTAANLPGHL